MTALLRRKLRRRWSWRRGSNTAFTTLLEIVSCLLKVLCLCCTSYGFPSRICIRHSMPLRGCSAAREKDIGLRPQKQVSFRSPYYLDEFEGRWLSCCSLGFIHSNLRSLGSLGWQLLQHFLGSGSCTACVAKTWMGPRLLPQCFSHPRHRCLLLADGYLSFSISAFILQLANPRRTKPNICSSHAGGESEVGYLWRLRPL